MQTPVELPDHEYLARPLIVAWLGYPKNERQRHRKLNLMQQLARNIMGQPLHGRSDATAKANIENGLTQLNRMVDRQLLAGEIFRRQLLSALPDDPGIFGNTSETNFARRISRHNRGSQSRQDYSAEHRSYWRDRKGPLALAVGVCQGLPERPGFETLLFSERPWALASVRHAERIRQLAISLDHNAAAELIEFRLVGF